MSAYMYLLTVVIIAGAWGRGESESITFPVKEIEECFQSRLKAGTFWTCFVTDCFAEMVHDVVPCFKLAYDLLYENSTHSLIGDRDVYHTAHCAIEKCAEGIRTNKETGVFGFIQSCIYGIKACVAKPRDEL